MPESCTYTNVFKMCFSLYKHVLGSSYSVEYLYICIYLALSASCIVMLLTIIESCACVWYATLYINKTTTNFYI